MATGYLEATSEISSGGWWVDGSAANLAAAVNNSDYYPTSSVSSGFGTYATAYGPAEMVLGMTPQGIAAFANSVSQLKVYAYGYFENYDPDYSVLVSVSLDGGSTWETAQSLASAYSDYASFTFSGSWSSLSSVRVKVLNNDPNWFGIQPVLSRLYIEATYTAGPATAYTLTGPFAGFVGNASTHTVTLNGSNSGVTITPATTGSGTFSPTSVSLSTSTMSATFTYTPSASGAATISTTNSGSLTNPSSISFNAIAARGGVGTNLDLWLYANANSGLSEGGTASTFADLSGAGHHASSNDGGSYPTWHHDGGNWCLRTNGSSQKLSGTLTEPDGLTGYTVFIVARCQMTNSSQTNSQKTAFAIIEDGGWGIVHVAPYQSFIGYRFGTGEGGNDPRYSRPTNVGTSVTITGIRHNGTAETVWTDWTSSPVSSTTVSNSTLAGNSATYKLGFSESNYGQWDIYEVLVYKASLSDTDMAAVMDSLYSSYYGTTPATGYTVSAPATASISVAAPVTATLTPYNASHAGLTVTFSDGGAGGSFSPSSVTLTTSTKSATSNYTAASTGPKTISTTNDGGDSPPSSVSITFNDGPPVSSSDLALWLDASTLGLSNGAGVVTWTDGSSNSRNGTQPTSGNRPTYVTNALSGMGVVRFSKASSQYLGFPSSAFSSLTAAELFIVIKASEDTVTDDYKHDIGYFGSDTQLNHYPFSGDGNIYEAFATNSRKQLGNPTPLLNQWRVYNVTSASGVYQARIDNTSLYSGTSNTVAWTATPRIGKGAGSSYFDGDIAEVIIVSKTLSSGERTSVYNYLDGKWINPNVAATGYSISAPPIALSGTAIDVVVSYIPSYGYTSGTTITLSDGGAGGTFSNTTVNLSSTNKSQTITYTPSSGGSKTISGTNTSSFTNTSATINVIGVRGNVSTNLLAWWNAATLTLSNSDPVSIWPNLISGSVSNATQTGSTRPTYQSTSFNGKPCINFNNTQYFDFTGLDWYNKSFTLVIVQDVDDTRSGQSMFFGLGNSGSSGAIHFGWDSSTPPHLRMAFYDNDVEWTSVPNYSSRLIITMRLDATTSTGTLNVGTTSLGDRSFYDNFYGDSGGRIGNMVWGDDPYEGKIAEVLCFDRRLTDVEVGAIVSDLNTEYGLDAAFDPKLAAMFLVFF